ncbi:radical SAM protein [Sorangium sp. So ce118]
MRTVTIIFKSLYSCQHQCGFCHVLYVPRSTSYMSTEAVQRTFDAIEARFAGCRVDLDMSGGEFALRRDAVELMRYLRTKKIHFSSLVLDTMAVPLADEALARELGALFTKVNVSVHAPDPLVHAQVSASKTDFNDLKAGLIHLFRYFPAVFTNTSINRYNHDRLRDIARFVLKARSASGRETPLFCAYYLPVYRHYGEAVAENQRRLQGADNADFLPHGSQLGEVRAELARTRALLELHGASAQLRDFNYPACVYHRVTGDLPEHAYGLPNFMNDSFFTDYTHPIDEEWSLEEVYPSMYDRVKDEACASCIAEPTCPGITREWRRRGYEPVPVEEAAYAAGFPERLINRTLHGTFFDPIRISALVDALPIDWAELGRSFFEHLARGGEELRSARARIAALSPAERARGLIAHLEARGGPGEAALAAAIAEELAALERLAQQAPPPASAGRTTGATGATGTAPPPRRAPGPAQRRLPLLG